MPEDRNDQMAGLVYVMTNSADDNEIAAFFRGTDGTLLPTSFYRTLGLGTGPRGIHPEMPGSGVDPLTSQGSLALSRDGRFLFAVNAGSNSISSFQIAFGGELNLAGVMPSGGLQPNSMAVFGGLLYVSNVGSSANGYRSNITGFRIGPDGRLTAIPGSSRNLSTVNAQPSCIVFSSNGRQLVVSELTTNRLSVFQVTNDGTLSGPSVNPSSGAGPFGSCFLSSGILLVTEAGANALSSYTVTQNGELRTVSGSVKNGQTATCWVTAAKDENYAYTSNAASGTITAYRVNRNGTLNVMGNIPSTPQGSAMGAPIDSGVSPDGANFYVLNGNQGSVSVFRTGGNGQLVRQQVAGNVGLPDLGAQGLAVR